MINNTILQPKRYGVRVQNLPKAANRLYNNLIIQSEGQYLYEPANPYAWYTSHNFFDIDTHGLIDPDNGQILDLKDSPIIDQGKDVSSWGITMDYKCNLRNADDGCDIGAYELSRISDVGY